MQDNEMDELFRSKLGGLEVEPTAQVWDTIHAQLGGQKKKSWAPIFSMAATVLVLLTAGTWFLLTKPVKDHPKQIVRINIIPKATYVVKATQPNVVEQVNTENMDLQPLAQSTTTLNRVASIKQSKAAKYRAALKQQQVEPAVVMEPVTQPQKPVLAAVQNKPVMQPVVPEMNLSTPLNDTEPAVVKPVNTLAAINEKTLEPERKVKRRGFHSLGGLINVVIATVDKREDKLIEFTETDEDQSNVTGINLGLLKIKKDK
ncbi:hypothetical protein ACFQ3S_06945 [Mucilaginibacter terrae]|uniref:hypothetical protein n=1 Tax=Mucilaginibacter terrae TaxID=1955052 RepID=UPI0036335CF1